MVKAIIFDLGSVCFDIDWEGIDKDMKAKYGISTLIRSSYGEEINSLYDNTHKGESKMLDVFKEICKDKNINPNDVSNYYKELYKKHKKINQKIKVLINKLKENFKIICFTNTNDLHFEAHNEQNHLGSFDLVYASFELGKIKEEKGAFDKILNDAGLKPNEVVFIDDHEKNINNAKSIGINAIKYENYNQLVEELNRLGINV